MKRIVPAVLLVTLAHVGAAEDLAGLVINEFSALGVGRDWVELYNGSPTTIRCTPLVLRDSLDGSGNEFPLCCAHLRPGEYRIVTCPNLLNGNGEGLGLYTQDPTIFY